jgi:hypothetical protein
MKSLLSHHFEWLIQLLTVWKRWKTANFTLWQTNIDMEKHHVYQVNQL